ncbi:MAG: response regulator transcription factor [Acidobacteria bacterium]|nr:response regulator transcription factor [Acidobacteriota bacterium]
MKVILADDHHLVRSGIRALLESITGVLVVAEAGDGREALELIERHRPDVALLDITMPGLNGLEVAARVRESSPRTRVVVLSMHAGETYVAQALRAGVAGYLLKDSAASDLQVALEAVGRGGTFLSPSISQQVVSSYLRGELPAADPLGGLSPRQREVLQLIAEGRSTKEIAADLELSIKTVETHRAQIMERLGIHDVPGLVRFAIRSGLISSE